MTPARARGTARDAGAHRDEQARERAVAAPDVRALTPESMRLVQGTVGNAAMSRLVARAARSHGPVLQRQPEIEPTDVEIGQKIVDDLVKVNGPKGPLKGVHYPHNYKRLAQTDPIAKAIWTDDCEHGYASSMWERTGHMAWRLLPGYKASQAIKTWLNGPTIAECASVLVAIELDALRAAVGDERFDELFSDLPDHDAENGLLRLTQFPRTSSLSGLMGKTREGRVAEKVGMRAVMKGEWYYFFNHPKYLLKHPAGAFQGENSVCMDDTLGAQKYSGFGVGVLTEPEMLDEMAKAYNAPRSEADFAKLVRKWADKAAKAKTGTQSWESVYATIERTKVPVEYWIGTGCPKTITAKDIVDAPELEVDGVLRKGGFVVGGGKKLKASRVAALRGGEKALL